MMQKVIAKTVFWTNEDKAPVQFPWLDSRVSCEIAIIGGGIAGALAALRFAENGIDVLLVSESPIGFGATAAAPGVISCQLDGGLAGLADKIGMDNAVKVFEMCTQSIANVDELCSSLETDTGFTRRDSLVYTARLVMSEAMKKEYLARRHNGFDVELLEQAKARDRFSFNIQMGILTRDGAAECDPYKLTHAVAKAATEQGARIYENTSVTEILCENSGYRITTENGKTVDANKVIFATGLENAHQLSGLASVKTTFTVVTAPVSAISGWHNSAVITSADYPYIRLRTTPDNRVVINGLESGFPGGFVGELLPRQQLYDKKFAELESRLIEMFPAIHGITPEFAYCGETTKTVDSLPVIGEADENGLYYALCAGENGIAFADIAATMLVAHYKGETHPDMELFSPNR
ncbi:MAG: FAD-binding oxidoreductase [Oscillospiraceae bacterium]|jgi:glycine/D-amino acid oxidase-like deaminating enzyme|nr:FAD-binding oxidoreductase [Oscillospiraceae bacterium]